MSSLPADITQAVTDQCGRILDVKPVTGGCINNGARIETENGVFFIKWNDRGSYPGMFHAEAKGLNLLASANTIRIPEVVYILEGEEHDGLLLEWIETRRTTVLSGERMGRQLAGVHRHSADEYGLDHSNFMGSLPQRNTPTKDLVTFFVEERLEPQVDLAFSRGAFSPDFATVIEKFYDTLPGLFEEEPPSLIHGDLWSGNYLVTEEEEPVLIDPAVAYGHREMDIAMTTLFGGFPQSFYEAYKETFPLAPGYEDRLDIYNLYPLLVHVNLFGGGYAAQVKQIIQRYV